MTSIVVINFHFRVPRAYIQNYVKNGPVVSEKSKFSFSFVTDLGPRSKNYLDFQYSHTFINLISCLHLPTFRSQATIVSEKATFLLFPIEKPKLQNLTLL